MNAKLKWAIFVGGVFHAMPFSLLKAIRLIPFPTKQRAVNRMRPMERTVEIVNDGLNFEVDLRNDVDRSIFFYTEKSEVMDLVGRVEVGSCAIDVGANVGKITLSLADKVGPMGKVFAFEPDEENLKRLRKNRDLNDFQQRIEVIPKAASDHPGEALFYPSPAEHSGWGSLAKYEDIAQEPIRVPLTTIDDLLREHQVDAVSLMKIDVEGAEAEVLKGAVESLNAHKIKSIAMEINGGRLAERGITAQDLFGVLTEAGYRPYGPEADQVMKLMEEKLPLRSVFIASANFQPAKA